VSMQAVKLNANQKRSLLHAVESLPSPRKDEASDVVVLVIGQGQALVGRPRTQRRAANVRDVLRWVEAAVDGYSAEGLRPMVAGLSAVEGSLLDDAGFDEGSPDEPGALERSRIEYELMLRESLTLEEAAKDLHVTTSRLRQRLSHGIRSIFGIKDGRRWRIPKFQFQKRGQLVRNIDKVLPHIRPDAHPLAIKTWFVTPHPDLVAGEDDKPVAPRAWLAAGRPVDAVALLAEEV